jgi:hypothetical protein
MSIVIIFALVAASASAATAFHRLWQRTDAPPRTFEGGVRRLEVELPAGRVRVRAVEGEAVRVRSTVRGLGNAPPLQETHAGELVRVSLPGVQNLAGFVTCEVEVPAHVAVTVRLGVGAVEVEGVAAEVDVQVGVGRVSAEGLAGPARLKVETGDVKGRGLRCPRLEARAELGGADLSFAAEPDAAEVHVSMGSVMLRVPGGPYRVLTSSERGQSRVRVPNAPDAPRTLRVKSSLGEVHVAPTDTESALRPAPTRLPALSTLPSPLTSPPVPVRAEAPATSGPAPVAPVAPVAPAPAAPAPRAAPPGAPAADPRVGRVDALCAQVLGLLAEGPSVLREVVQRPEATVEALRRSCHALVRREAELRGLWTEADARRLAAEREALSARIGAEEDAVVREHLEQARAALDAQASQRAALLTAARRLDAEHMRLTYTLEALHAQLLRLRSAGGVLSGDGTSGAPEAGLRESLERLEAEVDAVAGALESLHTPAAEPSRPEPLAPLSAPDEGGDGAGGAGGRGRVGPRQRG